MDLPNSKMMTCYVIVLFFPSRPLLRYDGEKDFVQSCMSVRFNTHGTQVLALRRRLPPILYNTHCEDSICQFYHADYFNSCTMKSCSFAGDNDEYVISGSDDFNLYMWRVTDANSKFSGLSARRHLLVIYIDGCMCVFSFSNFK